MGAISLEKSQQMYWLGRYTERVFTTMQSYLLLFDETVDERQVIYDKFCASLGIPDVYGTQAAFFEQYLFDAQNPNSIVSSLDRAFDNAVVLRDEISSESLSYIHLAMEQMQMARTSKERLLDLQVVIDYLYAFWGSVDDCADSELCRNLIKCGRYIERLDLYIRLQYPHKDVEKAYYKLHGRIRKSGLLYNEAQLEYLGQYAALETLSAENRVAMLESLAMLFVI